MIAVAAPQSSEKSATRYLWRVDIAAGAVAAAFITFCLIGTVRNYSTVPISADWDGYLQFNLDVLDGKLDAWWGIYGSHVPIIPRLLYWLDFHYFGARRIFLIVAAMLAQTASTATLIVYAREQIGRHALFAVSGLLITLAFAWTQLPNFWKGYNGVVFFPQAFFSVAGFYCLHRAKEKSLWFAAAVLAGVAAAGTNANGLLVLPVMAGMSTAIGLNLRRTMMIVLISAALFSLYFWDREFLTSDTDNQIANMGIARDPIQITLFSLTYLGSPFHYVVSYWLAGLQHAIKFVSGERSFIVVETLDSYAASRMAGIVSAMAAGVILVGLSAWSALDWLRQERKDTSRAALLALLAFLFLSAGAAAIGRAADTSFGYAVQERYTTPALLAWQSIMILLLSRLEPDKLLHTLRILVFMIPLALLPVELRVIVKADPMAEVRLESLRALQSGQSNNPLIAPLLPRLKARGIDLLR
jgi:hypothetical protein